MIDWSSEKIAKALKGSGLSHQERITTATQAWNNPNLFFPNKDDFLFDWVCSVLTMKPNMKNASEAPLFSTQYWKFLTDLLHHYTQQGAVPFIRVPLLVPVSTILATPSTTLLLQDITPCIRLLLSHPSCRAVYHPSLEQLTSLVEQLLPALQKNNNDSNMVDLAQVVLARYDEQLIQAGNQKKMFTTVITKILPSGLSVRRRLSDAAVSQQITDILCHCLFHQDTILEYTSVLTTQVTKNASYVSKLFEELAKLMTTDKEQDVLSVLPTLLSQFILAFRRKKHTTMAPTQDLNRLTEFGFFMQMYGIVEKGESTATALEVEALLLEQVLALDIYTARNDGVSKQQHGFLDALAARTVEHLKNSEDYDQAHVMDIIDYLLQIDITLVEHRMASIWPHLLQPYGKNSDSCLALAQTVLKSYAASRQIDLFVAELLDAIKSSSFQDIYTVLRTPLFSKHFLQEFSSIIAKQVPAPQILTIFELFTTTLKNNNASTDDHPKKKAKRSSASPSPSPPSYALLIATYLVEFLHSLRLGQHQRQAFERTAQELFNDFIRPSINDSHLRLPAIQIHFALTHTFYDVYWLKLTVASREWLVLELKTLFELEQTGETTSARLFLVHCANLLLQHVYFAGLHGNSVFSVKNSDLVNVVLDRVLDPEARSWQEVSWDGQLGSLKGMDHVKLAIWKLVVDEWFDPVCCVIQDDAQRADSFASLVLLSTFQQEHSPTTSLTLQLLNQALLRSANFYETECFHGRSIDMVVDAILQLFQQRTNDALASEISKIKHKHSEDDGDTKGNLGTGLMASLKEANSNLLLEEQGNGENQAMVDMIGRLVNLLLVFPLEYYAKHQRKSVVWLCFLADAWLWSNGRANMGSLLRGSLACRSVGLRFVHVVNAGILQANAAILQWWVNVLDTNLTSKLMVSHPVETKAWLQITKTMDYHVQTTILSMAGGKTPDANAMAFLKETLDCRFSSSTQWTLNFMDALVDYLPTVVKKQENLATSDLMGTLPKMHKMAGLITKALKAQPLETMPSTELADLLHGATLVQDYIHLLKLAGKEMDMTTLSNDVMDLITPMVTYLQSGAYDNNNSMAIHFAAAVSASHQATQQTMDVFWVVFGLVHADKAAFESLCGVFAKWIQRLAKEEYAELIDHIADHLDTTDGQILMAVMFLFMTKTNEGQRYRLKRMIPRFMLKLINMVGTATEIEFLSSTLDLLIGLSNETIFVSNNYDASLVLSCLLQALHPSTHAILTPQLDRAQTQSLFAKVCHVLTNLARLHRDALSDNMGPMVALLQLLLHSFKSAHVSLINTTKKRKSTSTANTASKPSSPATTLLTLHAPLDPICAERYARVCTQLTTKTAGGTQRSDTIHQNILKHVPFVLMAYFNGQSDPVCTVTQPALKTALAAAWHEWLELCTPADRSFIMAGLSPTGQSLFKSFYGTWKAEHKYSGQ